MSILVISLLSIKMQLAFGQGAIWANAYSNNAATLTVNGLRSNSSGENYTVGSFGRTLDFDPGPGVDTIKADLISNSSSSIAAFISKTDANGNHIWAKALMPYLSTSRSAIIDIDMDANANLYVAGTYANTVDFDPGPAVDSLNSQGTQGSFIMKLDAAGNLIWVHTFLDLNTRIRDIVIDENDDMIISGSFSVAVHFDPGPAVYNLTPANVNEVFVFKVNAIGNFLWAKSWPESRPMTKAMIDADDANNIYVSGSIFSYQIDLNPDAGVYADSGQSFIVKLDPAGNFIWGHARNEEVSMVLASNSNDLYAFGTPAYNGSSSYLSEYDSTGTLLWTKILEDPAAPGQNFIGSPSAMTQDMQGNLVVGGSVSNTYYLYTTDSLGNTLWVKKSGHNPLGLHDLTVKMSPQDEIMVAGDFFNVLDADFGAGIDTVGQSGKYSFFLMKYSYCGNDYDISYSDCDSIVLADTTYLVTANYANEYLDINGCDSNIFIHAVVSKLEALTLNACDSVAYNGQVYYQSGHYTQLVTPAVAGCDSILTIHVYINTDSNQNPFMQLIQEVPDSLIASNAGSVSVAVDSLYNMYIGGIYAIYIPQLNLNGNVGLVARFDSSGNLMWKHAVKDEWTNKSVHTQAICLDDTLSLHTSTIYSNYTLDSPDNEGITESIVFNNNTDDTTGFGPFPPTDKYLCILNDPTSNKMVKIGSVPTAYPNNPSAVIVKRGNSSVTFGAVANAWGTGSCYGETGAIDSQGNIYVCGKWQDAPLGVGPGQSGLHACFIAKLDSNLNLLWNRLLGAGTGSAKLSISNMILDHNSLLVSGNFYKPLDLDYTANTYLIYPADGSALLARFDTSANILWATPYGTLGNVTALGLTTDDDGQIYVSGRIADNVDLEPGSGISYFQHYCQNSSLGYVSKFSSTGTFIRTMGMHDYMNNIQFKSPNRIYASGGAYNVLVSVYELANDTTLYTFPEICLGDSISVGNSVYTQSGIYTNVFLSYLNTDSVVITNLAVHPLPVVIANTSDTLICAGDSVVLSGTGAYSYSWSNGAIDSQFFSPPLSNFYIVTGTDTNGCVNTDSINIVVNALPVVMAHASDTTLCPGDSVLLYGSGTLTYVWNNLVMDSVLFSPNMTNTYLVNGTDINGCVGADSITVIVNALPNVLANASDTTLCVGDSILLYGTGALSYTWNNLVTDSTIISPVITDTYIVAGTDTNGCINTDSITVIVNALPTVVANASDTSVCIGNPVILYGSGADSFAWTNNVSDSVTFYPIDTAMYIVTGIDLNGCTGQDSIEIITYQIPFPILVFSGDTLFCTNVTGVTYYWFKDTVAVDSLINYYVVTQNGNYEVLVVDSNGCVGADSISMLNIGFPTHNTSDLIQVYPNPTSGDINITVDIPEKGDLDLVVTDLTGNKIYASKRTITNPGRQSLKIDLSKNNLNSGIYLLSIVIDGRRHVLKFEYQN